MRITAPFAIRCTGVSKHQRVRVATSQPAGDDVWQGSSPSFPHFLDFSPLYPNIVLSECLRH